MEQPESLLPLLPLQRFGSLRSNIHFQPFVPPPPVHKLQLPVTMMNLVKVEYEDEKGKHHFPVFATLLKVEYNKQNSKKISKVIHLLWSPHPALKKKQHLFGNLESSTNYISKGRLSSLNHWMVRVSPYQWISFDQLMIQDEKRLCEGQSAYFINPLQEDIEKIPYQGAMMNHVFTKKQINAYLLVLMAEDRLESTFLSWIDELGKTIEERLQPERLLQMEKKLLFQMILDSSSI